MVGTLGGKQGGGEGTHSMKFGTVLFTTDDQPVAGSIGHKDAHNCLIVSIVMTNVSVHAWPAIFQFLCIYPSYRLFFSLFFFLQTDQFSVSLINSSSTSKMQ